MKSVQLALCVLVGACLAQVAQAVPFNFDAQTGTRPELMFVNFGEACFIRVEQPGQRYAHAHDLKPCFPAGDEVHVVVDEETGSLADECSKLNVLDNIIDYGQGTQGFTFKKPGLRELEGKEIASARTACGKLARAFETRRFDVYQQTVDTCRKLLGIKADCVLLKQTSAGVVVGFFLYLKATDPSSQCETLKAAQAQPANLVCTNPEERLGPDLRFRPSRELSQCPPLPPPPSSVPAYCSNPGKP